MDAFRRNSDTSRVLKDPDGALQEELRMRLGDGPLRFGPVRRIVSVAHETERLELSNKQISTLVEVIVGWQTRYKKQAEKKRYTHEQMMRVVLFCKFNEKKAISMLYRSSPRYFNTSALDKGISELLETKFFFPCPKLKTIEGHRVLYHKPSMVVKSKVRHVVEYFMYILGNMQMQEPGKEITLLANMEGYRIEHYRMDVGRTILAACRGKMFPAKISKILIVDPPVFFPKIWKLLQPLMPSSYASKFHFVKSEKLSKFFPEGFEEDLPNDMKGGLEDTDELLSDYVKFRRNVDMRTTLKNQDTEATTTSAFMEEDIDLSSDSSIADLTEEFVPSGEARWATGSPPAKLGSHRSLEK